MQDIYREREEKIRAELLEGEDDEDKDKDEEDDFEDQADDPFEDSFCNSNDYEESARQNPRTHHASDVHFKNLYRVLARKLHPDLYPNQTQEQKALWQELQNAYEWNDLSALESLHKRVQGTAATALDLWTMAIADIAELTQSLMVKLKSAETAIERESKTEHWDFENRQVRKSYLGSLAAKIKRSLNYEIESCGMLVNSLESDLKHRFTRAKKHKSKEQSEQSKKSRSRKR